VERLTAGIELAAQAVDSGAAQETLRRWAEAAK
jgi:anthranilate phosphoribosyltransferase